MIELHRLTADDAELLAGFLSSLPERDQTFFKEPIDPGTVRRWCTDERAPRWLLLGPEGDPRGYLAVIPGVGWSAHVGELRLVVAFAHRRQGLGTALARHGLTEGVRLGLSKLTVDVVADKQGDIDMFTAIGFEAEALLRNHFRDRDGGLHDLVILSHDIEEVADDMAVVGLDRAVGLGGQA